MNKLAVLLCIALVCAGCVPANPPPVSPSPAPQAAVAVPVIAPPKAGVVDMPAATAGSVSYPKNAIVRQKPLENVTLYPGSLKENVERIAAHYGWHQVVWDAPDYQWVGHAQIQGDNLSSVLRQLLADFPLQAVFYQGNHVLYIHPRTLK